MSKFVQRGTFPVMVWLHGDLTDKAFAVEATVTHEERSWESPGELQVDDVVVFPEGRGRGRAIGRPSDALIAAIVQEAQDFDDPAELKADYDYDRMKDEAAEGGR